MYEIRESYIHLSYIILIIYDYFKLKNKGKYEEPLLIWLQKKYNQYKVIVNVKDIKKLNERLFSGADFYFLPFDFNNDNYNDCVVDPEMNLFYWCLISNRIEIAKIFWRLGKVRVLLSIKFCLTEFRKHFLFKKYQICNALIAHKILNYFAKHIPDQAKELEKYARFVFLISL